jgi:hypothetical protein
MSSPTKILNEKVQAIDELHAHIRRLMCERTRVSKKLETPLPSASQSYWSLGSLAVSG